MVQSAQMNAAHILEARTVLRRQLSAKKRCQLCYKWFDGRGVGLLQCQYHPLQHFQSQTILADAVERRAVVNCAVCKRACVTPSTPGHFRPDHARHDPFASCRPADAVAEQRLARKGCTRIDHTSNLPLMLSKPYVVLPEFLWPEFALTWSTTNRAHTGDRMNEAYGSVLHVTDPLQMEHDTTRYITFPMPNRREPFVLDLQQLYNECAHKYGYAPYKGDFMEASKKRQQQRTKFHIADEALHTQALYDIDTGDTEFVAFCIVRRIAAYSSMAKINYL